MTHLESRICRALLSGLFLPAEVFENNLGLLSLHQFYRLVDKVSDRYEGVSLLQEQVYIYRGKRRVLYQIETEDRLTVDMNYELERLHRSFVTKVNEIINTYKLNYSLWDISHKFSEWVTDAGSAEIRAFGENIYKKYQSYKHS